MGSSEPDAGDSPGKKAHLHAAGKRQDGTWKLQFKKVQVPEDVEIRNILNLEHRSGAASQDG